MEILALEDDPVQQEILRRILHSSGVTAVIASSGEDGLKRLAERHFDAVFLDIGLPGKSGLQILHSLRENPSISHIPVVMLTADKSRETLLECKRLGVADYLAKPYTVEQLAAKLQNLQKLIQARDAKNNLSGGARVTVEYKPGLWRVTLGNAFNAETWARFRFHHSQLGARLKPDDVVLLNIIALPALSEAQRKILADIVILGGTERTCIIAGEAATQLREQMPLYAGRFFTSESDALKASEETAQ